MLALVLLVGAADAAPARRPNILVIVADDLGYADLGVQGCRDIPTPNIDSIARGGVRCTSGYVTGPYCSPSRAALMTGRYQQRFGHEFNPGRRPVGLAPAETTMARRLAAVGYATGMVGKWHLGQLPQYEPTRRGFQEFFGFLGGAHVYAPRGGPFGLRIPDPNPFHRDANPILRGNRPVDEPTYLTDALAREAVSYVQRHKAEPFFLYLAFNAVHTPLQAPHRYVERFRKIADPRRRIYAAMTSAMDDAVGAVLDELRRDALEQDTLVFFLSDNGGTEANASDNGPLRGHKATTWEGGIRVPFFVQWKGHLPAGQVYDAPVVQLDILPTALAAAGADVRPEWKLDGVNLLPHLDGTDPLPPHEVLFWRFGNQMAVRMGDWKLVRGRRGGANVVRARVTDLELYNLHDDLAERHDLAATEPQKLKQLQSAWQKWDDQLVPPAWLPSETLEQGATRRTAPRRPVPVRRRGR